MILKSPGKASLSTARRSHNRPELQSLCGFEIKSRAVLSAASNERIGRCKWLEWFLACLDHAIEGAESTLSSVLHKARFWDLIKNQALNERQRDITELVERGILVRDPGGGWSTSYSLAERK